MYSPGALIEYVRARPRSRVVVWRPAVSLTVIYLGLTSLCTDISSEMVASILPVYLVGFLRLSPAQFGIVDGLYQGVAAVVNLASGVMADRWGRHKQVAVAGYAVSALCRIGFLMFSGWSAIAALVTVDRLGKGVRTAPRDALISLSVPRSQLGLAFGIHRAMDAVGAMLGPLLAFGILLALPNAFDVVFVASLGMAALGLAVLGLFVENASRSAENARRIGFSAVLGLAHLHGFRHLAIAALVLGAFTISDGFIYLALQQQAHVPIGAFPLLYVATSAAYLVFAVPMGRLADRFGRLRVFVGGHLLLLLLYGMLTSPAQGPVLVTVTVLLLGLYYAATEGVLMALGSALLPEGLRTSGLAVLTTALALARLGGSVAFGFAWNEFGLQFATLIYLSALGAAIGVVVLGRPSREVA